MQISEGVSIEYHKSITRVIAMTNQSKGKCHKDTGSNEREHKMPNPDGFSIRPVTIIN